MDGPSLVEDAWQLAQKTSKELQSMVKADKFSFDAALPTLLRYRTQCDNCTLLDLRYAKSNKVEAKLWDAHVTINQRFRKLLHTFKSGEGRRRLVEQRKAAKQYVKFIKSSQRYYREYIEKLATAFGLPELDALAGIVNMGEAKALLPAETASFSKSDRDMVLLSYHETLIRLGDLSRYRETETKTRDRNWGPAVGYYNLAAALNPSSGASQNQLAAMAIADKHGFRAIYHLYRAIVVQNPYATARANLEREFKSIRKASEGVGLEVETSRGSVPDLLEDFTRLHALYYSNMHTSGIDELESHVLLGLASNLSGRLLESFLPKLVLTNIAAEHVVGADKSKRPQPYYLFQRLNLRTFSTILRILKLELESLDLEKVSQETDKLTVVMRHVLPSLRLYSSWIASKPELAQIESNVMSEMRAELWQTYTSVLTLLASTFRVDGLPLVEYMLQEDEDTVGFQPLETERAAQRYCFLGTNNRKPSPQSKNIQRHHPNHEMLSRVRDILTDVVKLVVDQNHPLRLCNGIFIFGDDENEEYLEEAPEEAAFTVEKSQSKCDSVDMENETNCNDTESDGGEDAMKHMVDDIVGPEDDDLWTPAQRVPQTDTSVLKPTPTTVSNTTDYGLIGTLTAQELVEQMHASTSPKSPCQGKSKQPVSPRPHLPSISPNPFTPIPGEFDNISPIVPRYPSSNPPPTKQAHAISSNSTIQSKATPRSPTIFASSPYQPSKAYRDEFKRAKTVNAVSNKAHRWGMGANRLPNEQG